MNSIALKSREPLSGAGPALLTSLLIVLFLFYIDEGYYNFTWMFQAGNWIVFFVYFIFTFTLMWIISHFLLGWLTGWLKWFTVLVTGFGITLVLIFTLFS